MIFFREKLYILSIVSIYILIGKQTNVLTSDHHGFASLKKITLKMSTFAAGTLVTYQAYAGLTSPVAVTAGKGLVGFGVVAVFPPRSFFFYGRPPGGFEGGGSFAYSAAPCATVFGKCSPLKMADVACTEGLF